MHSRKKAKPKATLNRNYFILFNFDATHISIELLYIAMPCWNGNPQKLSQMGSKSLWTNYSEELLRCTINAIGVIGQPIEKEKREAKAMIAMDMTNEDSIDLRRLHSLVFERL